MENQGFLPRERLQSLLDVLSDAGYQVSGPTVRDGAIVYDTLQDVSSMPRGVKDEQTPGHYRLIHDDQPRHFSWANGPQALKPLLFTPREQLWNVERNADGRIVFVPCTPPAEKVAIIGVRACDLAALRLQDQHFLESETADPYYAVRREGLFLVAVNCTHPAQTCFCASTGDGPAAEHAFDLVLSELDEGFIIASGSDTGRQIMDRLALDEVSSSQRDQAEQEIKQAAASQQRRLPSTNLRDSLFNNLEHPRWEEVAERCLSCSNCTSVCPTCFCHNENDQAQLDGNGSVHYREWDSCFTQGHSYIHGLTVRADTRLRYRQWLTHKLGSWHDQYGRSGCVGCGRCISWCPVGIDITEEAGAICSDNNER